MDKYICPFCKEREVVFRDRVSEGHISAYCNNVDCIMYSQRSNDLPPHSFDFHYGQTEGHWDFFIKNWVKFTEDK